MSEHVMRPRAFAVAGLLAIGGALLWWYVVFSPVVERGYGDYATASTCIWGNGYTCALLLSLCDTSHSLLPKYYRPELFWAGAALILCAIALALPRR